ncbi:hypothetical protein ANCCAN_15204 [Ancylostoma caninum]|uniref:Uncharacterized protein n=1 Tax=Ancylostoma caninum TaxID=29170 RepID=A0A368G6D5_ANCCA|nr:hypothetical protein ANCCAN_15204 [Ancylostoma caninum]
MFQESGEASDAEAVMLRLITPVVKLYTGKMCVPLISEAMECFGGQGYIEDTGIPAALRDAQVTPIWEGTTNVLSLDVLRVFAGKQNVYGLFEKRVSSLLPSKGAHGLDEPIASVRKAIADLGSILLRTAKAPNDSLHVDACARQIAFGIARIWAGALLIRHASDHDATKGDVAVAHRWCCEQPLVDLKMDWLSAGRVQLDRDIVFQNFSESSGNSKL